MSGDMRKSILSSSLMPAYCFSVLREKLSGAKPPAVPEGILNDPFPLFVSFKKNDGSLRGCIGCFDPQPLHSQLRKYAIEASTHDSRFRPVQLRELHHLNCSVSLLHNFEAAKSWRDWELGVHGIQISFVVNGLSYHATYLAHVAPSQGWNHEETLRSLIKKAGYDGPVTKEFLEAISITRYQETVSHCTYDEALQLLPTQ